ncbi:MAG: cytochrome c3 family protein [Planctomycetota bacterium]
MKSKWLIIEVAVIAVLLTSQAGAAVKGSPHDLSALGDGNACSFCHTPHGSSLTTPGWSHKLSTAVYKIYQSSSLEAKVGQPTGDSKMCLSCHDGTVALTHTRKGRGRGIYITPGTANLSTDLSDDHPISFVYSDSLSAKDSQIRSPLMLPDELELDRSNELQCTTCHSAHDNEFGDFLVMSNLRSSMCISCHDLDGWAGSSHESSTTAVFQAKDTYLKKSKYGTVADNGCLSCHMPHSAGGAERLLHFSKSEDNCLNCHDGSVAKTNLRTSLSKASRHDVVRYRGIHDLRESPLASPAHVECVDCHSPHGATSTPAQAPAASGAIQRVPGITASGSITQQIQYEYELCFKCHGDNPSRITSSITRQITQTNTRLEFDPSNPSYHPIIAPGTNDDVPSLKSSMTVATIIYCTDCHNSDSSSGPKGPHGSNYPNLLAYRYETSDYTAESESAYELCYQCHNRNNILSDESFPRHSEHLNDNIPCSACHDPHGISSAQGATGSNSHLINFDTSIVSENSLGQLQFTDSGVFQGSCSLRCHNIEHDNEMY